MSNKSEERKQIVDTVYRRSLSQEYVGVQSDNLEMNFGSNLRFQSLLQKLPIALRSHWGMLSSPTASALEAFKSFPFVQLQNTSNDKKS